MKTLDFLHVGCNVQRILIPSTVIFGSHRLLMFSTLLVAGLASTAFGTKHTHEAPHIKLSPRHGAKSFTDYIEKHITVKKDKPNRQLTMEEAETMLDEKSQNLRALKLRDNYGGMTVYTDSSCTTIKEIFGLVLNECRALGDGDATAVKVNRKDKTIIEMFWDNEMCNGVPKRIEDIVFKNFPEFSDDKSFGDCFHSPEFGDYISVHYWTKYPDLEMTPGNYDGLLHKRYSDHMFCSNGMDYVQEFEYNYDAGESSDVFDGICQTDYASGGSWRLTNCMPNGNYNQLYYPTSFDCTGTEVAGDYDVLPHCEKVKEEDADLKNEHATMMCVPRASVF